MDAHKRITAIFQGRTADRPGFWLGNPANETKHIYFRELGILPDAKNGERKDSVLKTGRRTEQDILLHEVFKSDVFWVCPHHDHNYYRHPEGKPVFDIFGGKIRESLNQPGAFAEYENVCQVEAFSWPNPDYLDLSDSIAYIRRLHEREHYIFSGSWAPFFHDLCDFFGMENYFLKMFTHPAVVEAATEKILEFYLEVNRRLLEATGEKIDAVFFGNDLGSQYNLLIGPNEFKTFILPGIKQIAEQARKYNLKVVLHSCGSVFELIPYFIEAGIDGLHPLQAKANNMDADTLAREFRGDLVFIGGVDTQNLLSFGTPEAIRTEIYRLKKVFGERLILSPSHEALLPNVSIENALAMRDAAIETI